MCVARRARAAKRAQSRDRAEDVDGDSAGGDELDERQHDGAETDNAEDECRQQRDPAQVGTRLVDDGVRSSSDQ